MFAESRYVRKAGACGKDVHSEDRNLQKAGAFDLLVAGVYVKKVLAYSIKRGVCAKWVFMETGACGKQEEPAESRSFRLLESRFLRTAAAACAKHEFVESRYLLKAGACGKQVAPESRCLPKAGAC